MDNGTQLNRHLVGLFGIALRPWQEKDPAGENHEAARLRALGKWRFILVRGVLGFSSPMFLFLALSHLPEDWHSAAAFHHNFVIHLLGFWLTQFCMSATLGVFVGLLAWRRLNSETWPGQSSGPESEITLLGKL